MAGETVGGIGHLKSITDPATRISSHLASVATGERRPAFSQAVSVPGRVLLFASIQAMNEFAGTNRVGLQRIVQETGVGVAAADGEVGAGVPSTPRTSPAGVRRAGIGVVSGVGGGSSEASRSVACSARCPREQPPAMATASARRPVEIVRFIFEVTIVVDRFCRFSSPRTDRVWLIDGRDFAQLFAAPSRKHRREAGTDLDLTSSQEECRHGSSGMGGSRRVPPFVFCFPLQRALRASRAPSSAASS